MASQTVTFPCPFCGRRMGVPAELLGKQVRCPHCKQVVLAPVSATPSGVVPALPPPHPPRPSVVVAPAPPAPRAEDDLPTFAIPQRKEGADSILSEPDESEDEVFGSQPGGRASAVPPLDLTAPQPQPAAPAPARGAESPFEFPTGPTAGMAPRAPAPGAHAPGPSAAIPNPFLELEPVTLPAAFAPPQPAPKPSAPTVATFPPPAPAPLPVLAPGPLPVGGNPFANFDAPTAPTNPPVPVPVPLPLPAPAPVSPTDEEEPSRRRKKRDEDSREEPKDRAARAARTRPPAPPGGGNKVALYVVIGYAVVVTLIAVYALFLKPDKLPPEHPLSTIPDNFGEFPPAERKKVGLVRFPVDGDLPANQRAALGEKVAIGPIEVRPVRIEKRRLVIETESIRGEKRQSPSPTAALVLTLAIKNVSADLTLHPLDPAFNRRANVGKGDLPITRLVVDKKPFAGGYLDWPIDYNKVKKQAEVQQANDVVPLKPGETREYVVFTDAKADLIKAAETTKDAMQWRVQVRRGLIEFGGKEVPVTAVIGVDFKATDIKLPD